MARRPNHRIRYSLLAVLTVGGLLGAISQWTRLAAQQAELTPPPRAISSGASRPPAPEESASSVMMAGERLVYNISWSSIPSAARLELELTERGQFFGQDSYQLRTRVQTLDQAWSLLGEVDNVYTTFLLAATGLPHRIVQSVNQGLQPALRSGSEPGASATKSASGAVQPELGEQVIVLDQSRQLATYDDQSTITLAPSTFDLPSLVYGLRQSPPEERERQRFVALFGHELIEIDAVGGGREAVITQAGTFEAACVRLTPRKKFKRYRATVCLSSDDRRLPVTIRADLPIGEFRAELISATVRPLPSGGTAQLVAGPASPPVLSTLESAPLPFRVGERLGYDISWGNFLSVGRASFEVRQQGVLDQQRVLELYGEATSTGAARTLIQVQDQISSFLRLDKLAPLRTDLRLREGRRTKIDSALFLDADRTARLNNGTVIEIPPGTLDLLSLFYVVRATLPEVGQSASYPFLDANHRPQQVVVRSAKQERIGSSLGDRETIQIDILSPPPTSLLIAQAWISRDEARVPLYFVTRTRFGELRFQLRTAFQIR
ncbi:MAG: DUF3108 domain-containing protein [Blastocatellia bacterium]